MKQCCYKVHREDSQTFLKIDAVYPSQLDMGIRKEYSTNLPMLREYTLNKVSRLYDNIAHSGQQRIIWLRNAKCFKLSIIYFYIRRFTVYGLRSVKYLKKLYIYIYTYTYIYIYIYLNTETYRIFRKFRFSYQHINTEMRKKIRYRYIPVPNKKYRMHSFDSMICVVVFVRYFRVPVVPSYVEKNNFIVLVL